MSSNSSCATCAQLLGPDYLDVKTEKRSYEQTFSCCGRRVCSECLSTNPRFATYCPFCQLIRLPRSKDPSARTPPQVQASCEQEADQSDEPPPYAPPREGTQIQGENLETDLNSLEASEGSVPPPTPAATRSQSSRDNDPPPYTPRHSSSPTTATTTDVVHHLSPDDTFQSLSLAYHTPIVVLRSHNRIPLDSLLLARRTILIPASYYQGPSLAPNPRESAVEDEWKRKIRRMMTTCKIHDYDLAVLYLKESDWNLEKAMDKWMEDERWEKEHPMVSSTNNSRGSSRKGIGSTLPPEKMARLLR